jgi:2-phosphosulfolactate phosphatase
MNVEILFGESGAREAARRQAVVVVIDALRASATATTALALGASEVIPVFTVEEAQNYVGRPGHAVAGERHGIKCPGFDFGNSPSEMRRRQQDLLGKALVLTTSNGTRVVNAAQGAAIIFLGTTINAEAVARAAFEVARQLGNHNIVLLAAGEYEQHAEEDYVGARTIARYLHQLGARVQPDCLTEDQAEVIFVESPSGKELEGLGYFEDVLFCARSDIYHVVPFLHNHRFVAYQTSLLPLPN